MKEIGWLVLVVVLSYDRDWSLKLGRAWTGRAIGKRL